MLPQVPDLSGADAAANTVAYRHIAGGEVPRVNSDGSITKVYSLTAESVLYGVQYTWFIPLATFKTDGAVNAQSSMTATVNNVCAHPHVQDFWTEQVQDRSNLLVNQAVITVGTDDGQSTTTVTKRMDQLGDGTVGAQIDAAWQLVSASGGV
jgi:hypothetical protein